ncbi:CPBP family intramembrane glutamic endopeptidase [Sellimonas intestinalis]|uniref:CPBP family intramembrane glutamic endopeptidase n=1 Tax=Sellimonas intestinalis TaxID=1653434 RepID=UPI0015EC3EDC|nr:CPBP family intramembrane glutamic endopeptidase [Sellimonas intestinalis]MBA2214812.1 CPBP family intramembrane metalloprotease [Sellimonas intestinalis]
MQLIMSSITTTIVNLVVFSLLPIIWWFFRHRKEENFFRWIGFFKPQLKTRWWVLLIFAILYYFFYNFDFTQFVSSETLEYIENSASVSSNVFAGIGMAAILPAFIENFIANGVAEEILYRGFLCKRLCIKIGLVKGIILQAVLFGLMHNILYILAGLDVGLWYHILTFIFTGMGALLLGWLNEKIFNGSIIPSILLHGAGNFIASMLVAFT